MAKGRGGGKTPERVTELLKKAVAEKSQSAVARESGLALLTVQRYLKGLGEPTIETLNLLAAYFRVPVFWLRGEWKDASLEDAKEYEALIEYMKDSENLEKSIMQKYGKYSVDILEIISWVGEDTQKKIFIQLAKRYPPPILEDEEIDVEISTKTIQGEENSTD